ncbi:MFS transporter, partial [Streptomyces sp. ISL-14]|nr:MFS transporter [Streptomyces sp. ISL-14]
AASATTSYIADHIGSASSRSQQQLVQLEGMVHGYTNAIWFAVGMLVLAAVIVVTLVNAGRPDGTTVASSEEGTEDEVRVPVVAH